LINLTLRVARLESADLAPNPEDVIVVIHSYSDARLNVLVAQSGHRIERGENEAEKEFIHRARLWCAASGHGKTLHGVK
jgi:hypothetical protein